MTIPDPLVYSSLPVLLGFVVWVSRNFVKETVALFKKDSRDDAASPPRKQLSIGDFTEIATLLKQELNGRYMFAVEARERFAAIERKIDHQVAGLKMFMQAQLAEQPVSTHSGSHDTI